jgi:hypothetical protein
MARASLAAEGGAEAVSVIGRQLVTAQAERVIRSQEVLRVIPWFPQRKWRKSSRVPGKNRPAGNTGFPRRDAEFPQSLLS